MVQDGDNGAAPAAAPPADIAARPTVKLSVRVKERQEAALPVLPPLATTGAEPAKRDSEHADATKSDSIEAKSPQVVAESPVMRDSKGWDGKLRLPKKAVLANPEALIDSDYSDEENVIPGEVISADEDLLQSEDEDTEEINCTHSRVRSLASLRLGRFRQCQRLCLRQNSIESLTEVDADGSHGLAALGDSLREIDLYDNLISHMRGVEALPHLTSLDLSFNKIRHVRHLGGLRQLTDLYLVANKIKTIEGLEGLGRLRMLELGSNRIRELHGGGLDGLLALEELWLAKNKLTSLEGLPALPRLRLLSVQANRLRDLAPLAAVGASLEELYVSNNALESLESLKANSDETESAETKAETKAEAKFETKIENTKAEKKERSIVPHLRVLDIGNNQIKSLRGTEGLTKLEEVWASYNQLSDFGDVEKALRDKEQLDTIYLEGNPLQLRGPALYRNKVRLALPQVKQIDASKCLGQTTKYSLSIA